MQEIGGGGMMEKYANTKRCSHIAVYYPARKFEIARMTLHTGNYWHTVCGVGSAILGLETSTLTDAPERPLCKHCQKKRAQKEALEPLMETTEKPSYCPEHHKWVIRIYPGGRNQWEIVPEKWDVQGAVSASNTLLKGECAWVADRETAENAWWLFQSKRAVR